MSDFCSTAAPFYPQADDAAEPSLERMAQPMAVEVGAIDVAPPDPRAAAALSWACIGLLGATTLVGLTAIGASAPASSFPFWLMALTGALASYHFRLRPIPRLFGCVSGSLQLCLILPLGMLLSFTAAASGAPFQDSLLLAVDRAIGFDWTAYAHFVDQRPWLALSYRVAYLSFLLQPVPLIILLAFAGRLVRLHLFTSAYTLCLLVTCLVFVFVPAVSVYAHLEVDPSVFTNLRPVSMVQHVELIEQMRAGTIARIDPLQGAGLITFPSFHACAAVLLAWGFWDIRPVRVPMLLINLTMLAATPIDGAHYLVDVIAGVLLAFGGIAAAKALEGRVGRPLIAMLDVYGAVQPRHPNASSKRQHDRQSFVKLRPDRGGA